MTGLSAAHLHADGARDPRARRAPSTAGHLHGHPGRRRRRLHHQHRHHRRRRPRRPAGDRTPPVPPCSTDQTASISLTQDREPDVGPRRRRHRHLHDDRHEHRRRQPAQRVGHRPDDRPLGARLHADASRPPWRAVRASTCTATYTVTQADVDAGQISNTATVDALDPADTPSPTARRAPCSPVSPRAHHRRRPRRRTRGVALGDQSPTASPSPTPAASRSTA